MSFSHSFGSFGRVVRRWAEQLPDQCAVRFLSDGEDAEESFSYRELDARARAIAVELQRFTRPGDRALLLYPPGLEYVAGFFGCLYAGVIAVPAYPPRANQKAERIIAMCLDALPAAVLTLSATLDVSRGDEILGPLLDGVRIVATDTLRAGERAGAWREPAIAPDEIAFLQYTSGSTAAPRGVRVSHANLYADSAFIKQKFGHSHDSHAVIWLPPYHDMGLIGGILNPIYCGFPVTLMAPVMFLQRPVRWLRAISRHRATTSGAPNFAYELCATRVTDEQKAELDLSTWDLAFNGAEPVRAETAQRFYEAFRGCGFKRESFYPCYGLAEATLMVSGGTKGRPFSTKVVDADELAAHRAVETDPSSPQARTLASSGDTGSTSVVTIVDPERGVAVPDGTIGEVYISGPIVAQGYWNQPRSTEETFGARIAGSDALHLRTGDLGFLDRGELYVTGRAKDMIILRGRNYYPQDLEASAEAAHIALRGAPAAAFGFDVGGEEQLAIAQEVPRAAVGTLDVAETVAAIREAVAREHAISVCAVALLRPGGILKTSSGKVRRGATAALLRPQLLGNDPAPEGGRTKVIDVWRAPSMQLTT
ncbi:MAG: hypothetical protein QOI11_3762 [Candidatus Eremiobacteraeota bacterium]|jgi:acyl-CoA synthetase (AMP-forming)/AMP-acid ligase II|nr:hypothetical protein [Candidatus Eremiobacteraeota bacterium]